MKIQAPAAIATTVIFIAAIGFYAVSIKADLSAAQRDLAAANAKTQQLSTTLAESQKNLDSVTSARDQLQTQLTEANAKLTSTTEEMNKQLAELQQKVDGLEAGAASRRKVAGYWRELIDYTKPKWPPAS